MKLPKTKYARSGTTHIAYQVVGTGPFDFVMVPGFVSNLDVQWEEPGFNHLLARFGSFSRLIMFDKRGTGLSDHVDPHDLPDLETRMDDVRAVMDAAGSKRAALLGGCEGGSMAMLFAATYPERTRALVLYGAYAHFDGSILPPLSAYLEHVKKHWGSGGGVADYAPSAAGNTRFCEWFARLERLGASPAAAVELFKMNASIDVREIVPSIRVPTLVLHRREDVRVKVASGRDLSARVHGAKYVELEGRDHLPWVGQVDQLVDEIQAFLTGMRPTSEADRVLATILIARPSLPEAQANDHGPNASLKLLRNIANDAIKRCAGQSIKADGIEIAARFDGPARALRCAFSLVDTAKAQGISLSAGVHTGEIELVDGIESGAVIYVTGRIAALARPGEVLASRVVSDLLPGTGIAFSESAGAAIDGVPQSLAVLVAHRTGDGVARANVVSDVGCLSAREKEVLALVADGLSNAAIGERLSVSPYTVKRHVGNILLKLNLPNRVAAASLAAKQSGHV